MAFLMFLLLIIFLIISYRAGNRNLLSPWFLLCFMFTATYVIVLLNYKNWDVKINGVFIVYILTAIMSFGLGSLIVNSCSKKRIKKTNNVEMIAGTKYPTDLFMILSVILSVIYCSKLLSDATGSSLTDKLRNIYDMAMGSGYSPGFVFNQCREMLTAIAYLNTFRLLYRLIYKKGKISVIKLIIPLLVFFIAIMVSTERNFFLRYAIYFVCMWAFLYRQKRKGKNVNLRIVLFGIIIVCIMLLAFFALGKSKQYTSDITRALSIYGGSGMYNFNLWIKDFSGPYLYGESTFTQLLNTIGRIFAPFGVELNGSVSVFDPFISFVSPNGYFYSTNIYTSLRTYIVDFGYAGVIIFPLIEGILFQWLFNKAKNANGGLALIMYCLLIYPVIYFPIGEQLFRRLHLGLLYEIVWPTVLFFMIYKRRSIKSNRKNKYVGVRLYAE